MADAGTSEFTPSSDSLPDSFFYRHTVTILNLTIIFGALSNLAAGLVHMSSGRWVLGFWALIAIIALPRAVLGLALILGRDSLTYLNLSFLLYKLYPNTVQRYNWDAFLLSRSVPGSLVAESLWIMINLIPVVSAFTLT